MKRSQPTPTIDTGILVLANGAVLRGRGLGAAGSAVGEVCFNTAMTGYQEILTDPSYAGQLVTFTFPHIGNVGVNNDDMENAGPQSVSAARGVIFRASVTSPSNYRSQFDLPGWLNRRGIIGLSGVDTRALTNFVREQGMPHGVIAHDPAGRFDVEALAAQARGWKGLEGADLASDLTTPAPFDHQTGAWDLTKGYRRVDTNQAGAPHIVVIDYGVKENILRQLAQCDARVTVLPATSSYETIMAAKPDGVVLSNGPGDPAATGTYAVPVIRLLIDADVPLFGICLGHQVLAIALGAKTVKMAQGHHGANHPVKNLATGKVEIVSMNHGFAVDRDSLPDGVEETHVSLFDNTNCGIALTGKPVSSVQHHPEASPGPQDSFYVFTQFVSQLKTAA
ncbi:MAG: glutamine-hydrolyzing carbamoyl-phosphate synthase small subunit [Pseudomonadota bacterium]